MSNMISNIIVQARWRLGGDKKKTVNDIYHSYDPSMVFICEPEQLRKMYGMIVTRPPDHVIMFDGGRTTRCVVCRQICNGLVG